MKFFIITSNIFSTMKNIFSNYLFKKNIFIKFSSFKQNHPDNFKLFFKIQFLTGFFGFDFLNCISFLGVGTKNSKASAEDKYFSETFLFINFYDA